MCRPDNYARCVNDCNHGNWFLFWAKDVEGETGRGERRRREGGGLLNLVARTEIYFSWGSCCDGCKLKDTIQHVLTQGPRLLLIMTRVVNQDQSRSWAFFLWLSLFINLCVFKCSMSVCSAYFRLFDVSSNAPWSLGSLMIRIWCSDRDNEVYITQTHAETGIQLTVLTENPVACIPLCMEAAVRSNEIIWSNTFAQWVSASLSLDVWFAALWWISVWFV